MKAPAVIVDGQRIGITEHAVDRYYERVRPTLFDRDAALADLLRVAAVATLTPHPPPWRNVASDPKPRAEADCWLMIGEDIAFPVSNRWALTCFARGDISEEARRGRAGNRRHAAQMRRGLRQQGNGIKATDRRSGMKRLEEQGGKSR